MKPRALQAGALLAVLLAAPPALDAAKFYRWTDRNGVTYYGDRPPETEIPPDARLEVVPFRNPKGTLVRLRLVNQGVRYQAWADNSLHGPVEVVLRYKKHNNVTSVPALPAHAILPARRGMLVASINLADPMRGSSFELVLDALPGDPRAQPDLDYEYRLPFEYGRVRVDQGFGGAFSHQDPQNYHAIDFALDIGTPIVAVRDGVVMQVESDFEKAGLNRERYGGRANFIRILHEDGTMALYAHLQWDGVLVRAGQHVRSGQRIGLSGNTGFTTGPHLHFVIQVNRGMRLESVPFRMFGPLGELKPPRL